MNNGGNVFAWLKVAAVAILAVILGISLYYIWKALKKIGSTAKDTAVAVAKAPIQALDYVTEKATGDPSFGGWIYSATHPDPLADAPQAQDFGNVIPGGAIPNDYVGDLPVDKNAKGTYANTVQTMLEGL